MVCSSSLFQFQKIPKIVYRTGNDGLYMHNLLAHLMPTIMKKVIDTFIHVDRHLNPQS